MCDLEAEDSADSDDFESGSDMDRFESDFIDDEDAPAENVVYGGQELDKDFKSEDEEEYFSESNGPSSSDSDEEEDPEERWQFERLEKD